MALTRAQLERLLDRLRSSIVAQNDEAAKAVEAISSAYNKALRDVADDLTDGYERLQRGEMLAEVAPGLSPNAAVNGQVTRAVWTRFERELDAITDRMRKHFTLYGERLTLGDVDEELLRTVKGQWPAVRNGRLVGNTGMAGRTYQMTAYHRQELANAVTRNVLGGADRAQTTQAIRERLRVSVSQADQLFHDASIQFARAVHNETSKDVEFFEYVGPVDGIIRDFCNRCMDGREQVRRVWSRDQINRMNNGQDGGPVFLTGGGYNCRHHWVAIARDWYTEEDWQQRRGDLSQMGKYAV